MVFRSVLKMGLPSMMGFVSINIYSLIDMFWVSKLGPECVAALTLFSIFFWVIAAGNSIIGAGSVAVISRRYGQKKYEITEAAIKETLILKWMIAILFGTSGFLAIEYILKFLGGKGEILKLSINYGRIQLIGLGFYMGNYSIYTSLRAINNPKQAMALMIISAILNTILDPLLIFGPWFFPRLEFIGAALASLISQICIFSLGLYIFYTGKCNIKLHLIGRYKPRIKSMAKIVTLGLPSGVSNLSIQFSKLVIMPFIALFGGKVIAVYGMWLRVSLVGITLVVGLSLGVAALIGHYLGAFEIKMAKKTAKCSILFGISSMGILAFITIIWAKEITMLFFKDIDLIELGIEVLRIQALSLVFIGLSISLKGIFAGAGDNLPSMISCLISDWIVLIPFVLISIKLLHINQTGIWWALVVSKIINASIFYWWHKSGRWLKKKV